MTDAVVADFTTDVIPDTADFSEPVRGRVLMNRAQVVIATKEGHRRIGVSEVFDIAYGSAPADLRQFFDDTVSIAYEDEFGRHVAIVEGADTTVQRFTNLLFKAVVNGTDVFVRHPARIGGRVTEEPVVPMTVFLKPTEVVFRGPSRFAIEVSTVSHFERLEREIRGRTRPVLSVRHAPDLQEVTTEVTLESSRKMNVLGRYLRSEYTQLADELADVDLAESELEALVGLYSGGDDASLAGVLGIESNQVTMILNGLLERGLVESTGSGMVLTPLGKMAVSSRIESVNA